MNASFNGFQDYLEFCSVFTESSLIGTAEWEMEIDTSDSLLSIKASGVQTISGDGILLWLKLKIPESIIVKDVPVRSKDMLFDNGDIPVVKRDGNIRILYCDIMAGDVDQNGEIQEVDAMQILKYLVSMIDLDTCQICNAYSSTDPTVSALDASLILQYLAGSIDTLPFNASGLPYDVDASILLPWMDYLYEPVIEIPILLTGNNIYSLEMQLTYNPEYMTFQGIIWPDTMSNYFKEFKINNGKISIVTAGETALSLTEDTLLTLRFGVNDRNFNETTLTVDNLSCNEKFQMFYVSLMQIYNELTAIDDPLAQIAGKFELAQNYPNPFNPITTISYTLPQAESVKLVVYDITGKLVSILINELQTAGEHKIIWNAGTISTGIYFYRIQAGKMDQIKKMILIR